MPKPICVKCQRFYRLKKCGYYFIEGMPVGPDRAEPGTSQPEKWKPYKLWAGDLHECLGCGHQLIVGFGRGPIAERHETTFEDQIAAYGADQLQVNDC